MKKKQLVATLLSAFCVCSASACSVTRKIEILTDSAKTLCDPVSVTQLGYKERTDDFYAFKNKANAFAAKFAPAAYRNDTASTNFVVSPVSVFFALGLAAECSVGETQSEILSALGCSAAELRTNYALLYRSLNVEHTQEGLINDVATGKLELSNSVWLDDKLTAKSDCLETLGEQYYCYGRSVDFDGDNRKANNSIQKFIKYKTNGLIDRKYELDESTLFALLNTLYLKDIWNDSGSELTRTAPVEFTTLDGQKQSTQLLTGYYESGRPHETETYTGFYTTTYNGYRLKFLVPNDGYTVGDVFTEENLSTFNAVTDFRANDDEQQISYYTRCLFPEYTAVYNKDVRNILQNEFGIQSLFDPDRCDFDALTSEQAYCASVTHSVNLTVNRKGIEGAAVTLMGMCGAAGPEYEQVYLDFKIDKAFGFLLTDSSNTVLFSGVVKGV